MNILITAAASARAHKLKQQLSPAKIILGDYMELPAFMLAGNGMIKLPNPASPAYAHEMLTLCLDKDINSIHVLRIEEWSNVVRAQQLFKEYGIDLVDAL